MSRLLDEKSVLHAAFPPGISPVRKSPGRFAAAKHSRSLAMSFCVQMALLIQVAAAIAAQGRRRCRKGFGIEHQRTGASIMRANGKRILSDTMQQSHERAQWTHPDRGHTAVRVSHAPQCAAHDRKGGLSFSRQSPPDARHGRKAWSTTTSWAVDYISRNGGTSKSTPRCSQAGSCTQGTHSARRARV